MMEEKSREHRPVQEDKMNLFQSQAIPQSENRNHPVPPATPDRELTSQRRKEGKELSPISHHVGPTSWLLGNQDAGKHARRGEEPRHLHVSG